MTAFFSNNFNEDRWRKAALKNAFSLLGKQRFQHSAAFFLLAGSLKDAVEVIVLIAGLILYSLTNFYGRQLDFWEFRHKVFYLVNFKKLVLCFSSNSQSLYISIRFSLYSFMNTFYLVDLGFENHQCVKRHAY